jgi:hypothetical protein
MKKRKTLANNSLDEISISSVLTLGLVSLNTAVEKLEKVRAEDLSVIDIHRINLMCITLRGQLKGYRHLLRRLEAINPLMGKKKI